MITHPLTPPIAAPSILSADFSRLAEELAIVDPARDWLHCDVMDHHFVPNLTFGPIIIAAVRKLTSAFLDVHLMTEHPVALAKEFREAGADQITIHLEALRESGVPLAGFDPTRISVSLVHEALARVRATGARVGLSLKPGTPFEAVEPYLNEIDLLLVMTVEPGFGGQPFRDDMIPKIREASAWKRSHAAKWLIEVDGGIAPDTARRAREAGAEVFVAGNAVFRQRSPSEALEDLRASIG